MPPVPEPPPPNLFPPGFKNLPIYAWRAFTNPTQSITSSVANPRPLSDIPQAVFAMIWYHSSSGQVEPKSVDYGDARPYTFKMPDGSTRINNTSMSQVAYQQLVPNILQNDTYPV